MIYTVAAVILALLCLILMMRPFHRRLETLISHLLMRLWM
jgi:hypothetical protein